MNAKMTGDIVNGEATTSVSIVDDLCLGPSDNVDIHILCVCLKSDQK